MKKQYKSQASSARAGGLSGGFGSQAFASSQSSILSYVQELPDYSSLPDATVAVAFKNLSKKDATTKAKALEDLQTLLASTDLQPDESILDAWAKVFPRLSIDNARRVRQLAYSLNGRICSKAGKRTAKHMSRIAGPWLAGAFDTDRAVAKAASDALNAVFPTSEKIQGVLKTFKRSIVEYCRDAVLHETVQTLSDERVVSPEDALATYYRVIATTLSVINKLIVELPLEDQAKGNEIFDEIFSGKKLWEAVSSPDASVRRAMHRLIRACINKSPSTIQGNLGTMSNAYVYKGLNSSQIASALDFVKTLLSATTTFPTIWTDAYNGKNTAISRLRHFLKQGSQLSPAEFWDYLSTLVHKLPSVILPKELEEVTELLAAARAGVSKKEERSNASSAWPSYFKVVDVVLPTSSTSDCETILQTAATPLLEQFLFPDLDKIEWTISSPKAAKIASQVASIRNVPPLLVRQWPGLADRLIELAKMSQPEQSKDYDKSQTGVAAVGGRWASLQKCILALEPAATAELTQVLDDCNMKILDEIIPLLKSRNGKPYGAAGVIEHLLRASSDHLLQVDGFRASYIQFIEADIAKLAFSPSGSYLMRGLLATQLPSILAAGFTGLLQDVAAGNASTESKMAVLRTIFTPNTPDSAAELARSVPELQQFVIEAVAAEGGPSLFSDLVGSGAATSETSDAVLSNLTTALSVSSDSKAGLSAIDDISRSNQHAIQTFMAKAAGAGDQLLPSLLRLEQSPDDSLAEQAAALSTRLSSTVTDTASNTRFAVVVKNLEKVSRMSMPVEALHELTMRLLGSERKASDLLDLLPSTELWKAAILSILEPPAPSLALMSALGGAVHLVQPSERKPSGQVQYDAEGFSQALRLAMFASKLLTETGAVEGLDESRASILALLQLSIVVAEDSVSVLGSNGLWRHTATVESEAAVLEFISEANTLLATYSESLIPDLDAGASTETSRFFSALKDIESNAQATSPISYYIAVCVARVYSNLIEIHGFSTDQVQKCEATIKAQRSEDQQIDLTSSLVGFQQPLSGTPTLTRIFNELVAHLTDANVEKDELRFFSQVSLLNTILRTQDGILEGTPSQRLIFLVKKLLVLAKAPIDIVIKAEVLRALATLLPGIADMYGEHWAITLDAVIDIWTLIAANSEYGTVNESHVLLENTTLRLLAALRKLAKSEEPNDDLVDSLKEKETEIQDGLIKLVTAANGINDEDHQPLRITHELLARQVAVTVMTKVSDIDELYPLVYAPSRSIQQAAFGILHKEIPVAQEKISFDAALDNKTAQLPEELLSLILEPPTLESLANASFERTMPLPLQGYLYSWRLIFDFFQGSSYKVKSDYIEQLKDGTYLSGLLSLAFDFLGHTNGRPVDVSKFSIREYTSDDEPSPEKDVQWLLTHLYYLALTHLPSLVRSYYLEIRSRQLPQLIETWTAKHVSPHIIEASLKDALEWAEKPKEDPEYENVTFKVGFRSREITTSYEIDEQIMSMKIVLPEAYPLASAQVVGINRVAVNEEKWQSWLRNCQGVIAFSNGSLIDGLSAWRRNATGAMKGQTECAICYSIVSADKKVPNKKCPTCKHMFHSSCLAKWFKTSNASTCPLCRNTFSFL